MPVGRRPLAARSLAVLCCLALAACAGGDDERAAAGAADAQRDVDCQVAVDQLLVLGQRYLDSIEGSSPPAPSPDASPAAGSDPSPSASASASASGGPAGGVAEEAERFRTALSGIQEYAGSIGCEPARFQERFRSGLAGLSAGGPVARAVQLQLQAETGRVGQPRAALEPGADVAAAVAATPSGGTVRLAAGRHEVPETLVLLRGITLVGAGRDSTELVSSAGGGTLLLLTDEVAEVADLTLRRTGTEPGSVVTVGPSSSLTLRGVRAAGGVSDAEGADGVGVLLAAGPLAELDPARPTTLVLSDAELVDNGAAGMLVNGEHRVEATGLLVERNGQCGICFLGRSDGTVRDSTIGDNPVGLLVGGSARPAVSATAVRAGDVGVQVTGAAAPDLRSLTVAASARAAVLWSGTATGTLRGSTCEGVPFGVVVGPQAAPTLEDNDCELARGQ